METNNDRMKTHYKIFYAPDRGRLLSLPHLLTTVGQVYPKGKVTVAPKTGPLFGFVNYRAAVNFYAMIHSTKSSHLELWRCEGESINELVGIGLVINRDLVSRQMCADFWDHIREVAPSIVEKLIPQVDPNRPVQTICFDELDRYYVEKIKQYRKVHPDKTPFETVPLGTTYLSKITPLERVMPR